MVDQTWSELVYTGLWMDPLKENLDSFIDSTQDNVSGTITIKMYKGSLRVVGRSSRYSIYNQNLATYSSASKFNQNYAEGFIELWGLPSRAARIRDRVQKVTAK